MSKEVTKKARLRKSVYTLRLDLDTWLTLNDGDMPKKYVREIYERLVSALNDLKETKA